VDVRRRRLARKTTDPEKKWIRRDVFRGPASHRNLTIALARRPGAVGGRSEAGTDPCRLGFSLVRIAPRLGRVLSNS
jgi:hypothetical protein